MKKLILIGGGGHAKVMLDILSLTSEYEIIGIVDKTLAAGENFAGHPILGDDDVLEKYLKEGVKHAALGVGGFADNKVRKKIFQKISAMGFDVINVIHPSCEIMPTVTLGKGVVMYPGCAINSHAVIGNNVVMVTGATVDHETVVEDHVLISAGVTVGAYARVCEEALIAIGATVVSDITIGRSSLVAAGAVVVEDVAENIRVAGVPAKIF